MFKGVDIKLLVQLNGLCAAELVGVIHALDTVFGCARVHFRMRILGGSMRLAQPIRPLTTWRVSTWVAQGIIATLPFDALALDNPHL